jgi:glycosyltransferase involved in cell wall biosynthesis
MFIDRHSPRASAAPRLQVFVSDLSATGVVRNAVAIANAAAAAGYEVRLLTCRPEGPLRVEVSPRVTVINLAGSKSAGARSSQLRAALLAYRRHSRDWRPDILFSAGNHAHLLSTIAWIGLPGAKVLRISNDLGHGSPGPLTRLLRSLKFRLLAARADRLVLVSRALRTHPLLQRLAAGGKAVTIPNGVDVEAVTALAREPCPHPWARDDSVPIVLAVGRHVPQKNFGALLEAFARARSERPMRLIFLGAGPNGQTERLRALAAELSVAADVDFVAPTSNPFPYMAAASVVALPSRWEGSANVLLEALACGTAVIASRTAGDAEHVLGSGSHGILIDPDDVAGLASALLRQTGDDRVEAGNRAAAFDRQGALRQYVRLFDQLASAGEAATLTGLAPAEAS